MLQEEEGAGGFSIIVKVTPRYEKQLNLIYRNVFKVPASSNNTAKVKVTPRQDESFDEDRVVTFRDVKLIMPTLLILLFTLFILVTVIPYAFYKAIHQLHAVQALEEAGIRMFSFIIKYVYLYVLEARLSNSSLGGENIIIK